MASEGRMDPPEGLLDDVKKRMSRRPLYRVLAVAASICIVAARASFILSDRESSLKSGAVVREAHETPEPERYVSIVDDIQARHETPVEGRNIPDFAAMTTGSNQAADETIPVNDSESENVDDPRDADTALLKYGGEDSVKSDGETDSFLEEENFQRPGKFSVGADFSRFGSGDHLAVRGLMMASAAEPYGLYSSALSSVRSIGIVDAPYESSKSHDAPIRAGISVRYALNHRWSLQSGILYSFLKSEFSERYSASEVKSEQKLHYVGIPLGLSYDLWNNGRLNLYLSAGAMGEKLISGRLVAKGELFDYSDSESSKAVKENRIVMSFNASGGLEYIFSQNVSLYAEPGVAFYPDGCTELNSAYSDHRAAFDMKLGIRFSFKN